MADKALLLLAALLVIGLANVVTGSRHRRSDHNSKECSVHHNDKIECGYPGISAEHCHRRGCCFDSSTPGVKLCYFPLSAGA
ncbi:trefoil factor 3-like [Ambystoma mexicanum]|uniref:trefoil factor 3-like n=1 Tax=Ambystoma mexicanum TaxID=8296 RepID=UPI0037E890A4